VTLPNILPGVTAGAVFAFLASFDEATVAFFISDIGGKSIGRKMFEDIDFNLTPVIAAASTVVVAASLCLIGVAHVVSSSASSRAKQE
jgi:mannopine transport system permease protein